MGHYASEISGPPFIVGLQCELNEVQSKTLENLIKPGKEKISNLKLKIETVTTDKTRKWFNLTYDSDNLSHIKESNFEEISDLLGKEYVSFYLGKLESKRLRVYNP